MAAALRCRCPRCGEGRLFRGLLTLAPACDRCGLPLARNDNGDGPAFLAIVLLGAVVVPLVLWIQFALTLPIWAPLVYGPFVVFAPMIVVLRPAKAYFLTMSYRHRRFDFD